MTLTIDTAALLFVLVLASVSFARSVVTIAKEFGARGKPAR